MVYKIKSDHSNINAKILAMAFHTLTRKEREKFFNELLSSGEIREEIEAALLWEFRKNEPRRPIKDYLAESKTKK